MRAIGLDLGTKRIGVAVSDRSGTIASPLTVIHRAKRREEDHRRIAAIVAEEEAEILVVGMPLHMSGAVGPSARSAATEARLLTSVVGVPVTTHDERLTTVTAERALREASVRGTDRRNVIDKVAAAVMLQAWLDSGGPARARGHAS